MTVEQILANNSLEEGISIIISSKEQYDDCCRLLDRFGYTWRGGYALCGKNALTIPECESENDYALLILTLRANKNVTQTTFFNDFETNGFKIDYFKENCNFLFIKDDDKGDEQAFL